MPQIVVLGSSGMLGQQVSKTLRASKLSASFFSRAMGAENFFSFGSQSAADLARDLSITDEAYVINCIGWIPQKSRGNLSEDAKNAWGLNFELPQLLEELSVERGVRVLQIATDCVFDGRRGEYLESDQADATDLYGTTKREGEKVQPSAMKIRASVIGNDNFSNSGLYAWYKSQPNNEIVSGYLNHRWNGVTTNALARLFLGIIVNKAFTPGVQHWIPHDSISKFELLRIFMDSSDGGGALVVQAKAQLTLDRTLSTNNPTVSEDFWSLAGYSGVPSIASLVQEMITMDFS